MSFEEREELSKILGSQLFFDNDSKSKYAWETEEIPIEFSALECPFAWKYEFALNPRYIVNRIEEKLRDLGEVDEELLPWNKFIYNMVLCFEYAKTGDLVGAIQRQSMCDQILDDKSAIESSSAVLCMGSGLRHISLACKCYLLYASHMLVDVEKICDSIVPFDKLLPRDQASVLGAKSAYCAEFGYRGMKESITLIEKAIEIDDSPEWYYLLGRSLGRLRRLEKKNVIPEKRELQALEISVEKNNNLSFMVLLAQTYRETSHFVFKQYVGYCTSYNSDSAELKTYCDSLNSKSKKMYMKVLKKGKNDVRALTRCALGFMKLPNPWKDMNEAEDCILKALDLAPDNPMTNHVAGTFFSCIDETKRAMYHFSKAAAHGVFGAELDLITIKTKNMKSYDPLADLERLLDVYKEKPLHETLLCYVGTYHYVKNDIKSALKFWLYVLEADIHSEALKSHYNSVSFNKAETLNINKIIIEEVMKLLDEGKLSEFETESYNKIIRKYILFHPSLISKCTTIDITKLSNQKFEYSSWKKEGLCWRPHNIPSSQNKNQNDKWRKNCFDGKNLGTNVKYKNCDVSREVVAGNFRKNQPRMVVASSSSKSYCEVSTSTASRGMEFEKMSNANHRGREVHIKSYSKLDAGKFYGPIHQVCSEREENNALEGDGFCKQKQNFHWHQSRGRGGLCARDRGRSMGWGRAWGRGQRHGLYEGHGSNRDQV